MEFWVGLVEKLSQMRHRSVVQIKKSFPSILKKNKNTIFLLFSKKGVPLGEKKASLLLCSSQAWVLYTILGNQDQHCNWANDANTIKYHHRERSKIKPIQKITAIPYAQEPKHQRREPVYVVGFSGISDLRKCRNCYTHSCDQTYCFKNQTFHISYLWE